LCTVWPRRHWPFQGCLSHTSDGAKKDRKLCITGGNLQHLTFTCRLPLKALLRLQMMHLHHLCCTWCIQFMNSEEYILCSCSSCSLFSLSFCIFKYSVHDTLLSSIPQSDKPNLSPIQQNKFIYMNYVAVLVLLLLVVVVTRYNVYHVHSVVEHLTLTISGMVLCLLATNACSSHPFSGRWDSIIRKANTLLPFSIDAVHNELNLLLFHFCLTQ
jgi:hypothetical protein